MSFEISSIAGSVYQSDVAAARARAAQYSVQIPEDRTNQEAADTKLPVINGLTGDTYIRSYVDNTGREDTASRFPGSSQDSQEQTGNNRLSDSEDQSAHRRFHLPGASDPVRSDSVVDAFHTRGADKASDARHSTGSAAETDQVRSASERTQQSSRREKDPALSDRSDTKASDVTKMSASERAALIRTLRLEQQEQHRQFIRMIRNTFGMQAAVSSASDREVGSLDPDILALLSQNGNVSAAEAQAAARQALGEDGFYGVTQTSNRLFQMAITMSGGDADVMRSLQNAILAGYSQAASAWGTDLPGICADTLKVTNRLFDNFYSSPISSAANVSGSSESDQSKASGSASI